jgi:hypothetical protein
MWSESRHGGQTTDELGARLAREIEERFLHFATRLVRRSERERRGRAAPVGMTGLGGRLGVDMSSRLWRWSEHGGGDVHATRRGGRKRDDTMCSACGGLLTQGFVYSYTSGEERALDA